MLSHASYGKSGIRLVKITRHGPRHDIADLTVAVRFHGDYDESYTQGDNRHVLPTDTMKNTVYALAADAALDDPEPFALILARHFLDGNPRLDRVSIDVDHHLWEPIAAGAGRNEQSFTAQGPERRLARIGASRDATVVEAGVGDVLVLKSSRSAFTGFMRDELTTLAETSDRILATSFTATWTYAGPVDFGPTWHNVRRTLLETFAGHESASVQHTLFAMGQAVLARVPAVTAIHLVMPNKHHVPVDLTPFGKDNRNEVFVATTEPFGLIEATVRRA